VADEKGKADTDRCDECGVMLFNRKHEDGEDQERSQEHFDEESLSEVCACGQGRCHSELLSARTRSAC
jgi:hypothetical protein